MVCDMGLLDDAIREHLELKRRRGADPGEVARQQREALAPVVGGGDSAWEGEEMLDAEHDHTAAVPDATGEQGHAVAEVPTASGDEHPTEAHETVPVEGEVAPRVGEASPTDTDGASDLHHAVLESMPHVGQETAEIDMETVLEPGPRGAQLASSPPSDAEMDDGIEWEMPSRERDELGEAGEVPREIPGQERMSFE